MTTKTKLALLIAVVIIVAGIGVSVRNHLMPPAQRILNATSSAPSLTDTVDYTGNFTPEVKVILVKSISDLRASLSANVTQFDSWLLLAIRYKMAGDYNKAGAVWEYLSALHPDDAVSRHNLGDLYQNFLHDFAQAEGWYLQAIQADVQGTINYLALHDLYKNLYKQGTGQEQIILLRGIDMVKGPPVIDLEIALANDYAQKGDKQNAIVYYTKARDEAKKVGDTKLVTDLNAAIKALGK